MSTTEEPQQQLAPKPAFKKHSGKVQKEAAKILKSTFTQISSFAKVDPFNKLNCVIGLVNRQDGVYGGSLVLTHVNNVELPQKQLVYGTPKLAYPYKNFDDFAIRDFQNTPDLAQYVVTNKYNGSNILFYKYKDATGNTFISAKTKGSPFISNSKYAKFYDLLMEVLGIQAISEEETGNEYDRYPLFNLFENPPDSCPELQQFARDESLQSMVFELCGQGEPHLVNYPFKLSLKCLFTQTFEGEIKPWLNINPSDMYGPVPFDQTQLENDIKRFQKEDLETNQQYRKERNLPHKYEYNHFATEGRVLYLLDDKGQLVGRTMYKIKPEDIEEVHWGNFDQTMRRRVDEAIQKVIEREKPMSIQSIREELDMLGEKEWSRYQEDVTYYVQNVKKPDGIEHGKDKRRIILVTGHPCSGKSAFAKALNARTGGSLFRIDKSVKDPKKDLVSNLHKRKHILMDLDCFSASQRASWVSIANEEGLSNENVIVVVVSTPLDYCQEKVKDFNLDIDWNQYEQPALASDAYLSNESQILTLAFDTDEKVQSQNETKLVETLLTLLKVGKKKNKSSGSAKKQNKSNKKKQTNTTNHTDTVTQE